MYDLCFTIYDFCSSNILVTLADSSSTVHRWSAGPLPKERSLFHLNSTRKLKISTSCNFPLLLLPNPIHHSTHTPSCASLQSTPTSLPIRKIASLSPLFTYHQLPNRDHLRITTCQSTRPVIGPARSRRNHLLSEATLPRQGLPAVMKAHASLA